MSVNLRYSVTVIIFKEFFPKQEPFFSGKDLSGCVLFTMYAWELLSSSSCVDFPSQPFSVPVFREASCLSA